MTVKYTVGPNNTNPPYDHQIHFKFSDRIHTLRTIMNDALAYCTYGRSKLRIERKKEIPNE
jgi:hypothetical protein